MAMLRILVNVFLFSLIAAFMFADPAEAQLVKDGLVAYWPLDAATMEEDIIGNNTGKLEGGPKTVGGKVGEAMRFNGSNSVDIKGTDKLDFSGADKMTVMAWVNAENDDPVVGVVAGCCGTIVAQRDINAWALRYDGRNGGAEMEFIVCPNWQGDGGFGSPKIKAGEWHHLAGVVDGAKMFLYLDGALVKEQAYAGPMTGGGTETEIGHANDGGFVGLIDEVMIYNKALSEKEIKQNFQAKGMAVELNSKLAVCWGDLKK